MGGSESTPPPQKPSPVWNFQNSLGEKKTGKQITMGGSESTPPPQKPSPVWNFQNSLGEKKTGKQITIGGSESTPPPQKPSPEFDKPWRETPWDKKEVLEKKLRELNLSDSNVKYIRILLAGAVGAGKSSFINSVNSVFQGRITTEALADSESGTSFTKTYRTYYIRNGQSLLPFVFNDIMGLEPGDSQGADPEDIAKSLEGLLKEGHKFNPTDSVKNYDCRSETSSEDLTYCLVYVIAADKVSMMNQEVFKKMRYIREKASILEIPQAVIMTKVDEACPLVQKDLRKIYTSKKIKEKMQECSSMVGVPVSHIFPVKNYHEEIDTQNDIDVLILRALTQILQIADDLLNRRKSHSEK